jgi:hypothetical protein
MQAALPILGLGAFARNLVTIGGNTRAGMVIVVGGAKVAIGDVRVDLGSGDIAMAKQCLDRTRVGAMLQKVSCEAVA